MIEDSLGRTVDAGSVNMADLKAMLSSLMSSKTTNQSLPKSAENKDTSKELKEIVNLMSKLSNNLAKDFVDTKKYLEEVVKSVNASQNKSKEPSIHKDIISAFAAVSKNLGKGGKSLNDNLSNAFSKDMQSMSKSAETEKGLRKTNFENSKKMAEAALKKGSLYTHDEHTHIHLDNITKQLVSIVTHLGAIAQKPPAILPRDPMPSDGTGGGTVSGLKDSKQNKSSSSSGGGGGGGGGYGDGGGGNRLGRVFEQGTKLEKFNEGLHAVTGMVNTVTSATEKLGDSLGFVNTQTTLFGGNYSNAVDAAAGMQKQEREIAIEAKKIAYETQGITKAQKYTVVEGEKVYKGLLLESDVIGETGFARIHFQKLQNEYSRKGIKDQDTVRGIISSQLHLEKQLGMEAGALGDDFVKLHQESGFTKVQIAATATGMMEVARQSGLTGKELKAAMDSSKGIMDNMRNAGTLTVGASKNIVGIMAEAQKLGTTEQSKKFLDLASSSSKLMLDSSSKTATTLRMAAGSVGKMKELQEGTLLHTKEGVKSLAQGMNNTFKGVLGITQEEFKNLNAEQKMKINIQAQTAFDMDAAEFIRITKGMEEGGKTYADQLEQANKDIIKGTNLSVFQKEKNAAIEAKIAGIKESANNQIITSINEQMDGAKNMNDVAAKFNESLGKDKDMQETLQRLSGKNDLSQLTNAEKMSLAMRAQLENVNKGLVAAGKKERVIDASRIESALNNKEEFAALTEEMQAASALLKTEEKSSVDPALKVELELLKANEKLAQQSMYLGEKMAESINPTAYAIAAISAASVAMALNTAALIANTIAQGLAMASQVKTLFQFGKSLLTGGSKASLAKVVTDPMKLMGPGGLSSTGKVAIEGTKAASQGIKAASGLTKILGKFATKIPLLGGLVEAGISLAQGEGVGKAASKGGGAIAGGMAGASAGAAIGLLGGPIGVAVGGFVGSIVGAFMGSELGSLAWDYILGPMFNWFSENAAKLPGLLKTWIWDPIYFVFVTLPGMIGKFLADGLMSLVSFFLGLPGKIFTWVSDAFAPVGKFLRELSPQIYDWISNAFASVVNGIASMGIAVGEVFMGIWDGIVGAIGWMGSAIGGVFMWVWDGIVGAIGWMGSAIGGVFMSIWNGIVNAISWMGSAIGRKLGTAFSGLFSFFGSIGSKLWGYLKEGAKKIPGLSWLLGSGGDAAPAAAAAEPVTATEMTQEAMPAAPAAYAAPAAPAAYAAPPTAAYAQPVPSVSGPMATSQQRATMAAPMGGGGSDMGGHLSSIAKSGEAEVTAAQQMIGLLEKMVGLLSPSGAAPAMAGPSPKTGGTENYFKLPTGNFNESSIREVTNL